ISQLRGDVHAEAVLAALTVLETMSAELTLPLLCYAELWTGVELLPEADRPAAAETLERMVRASRGLLVAGNVGTGRAAAGARAQAAYRRRGGRREVLIPDFVIGANATYYAGRLLTTNPRDFFKAFPTLEVLTPQAFLAQYVPAPQPRDRRECAYQASVPPACYPRMWSTSAWHKTRGVSRLPFRAFNSCPCKLYFFYLVRGCCVTY